MGLLDQLMGKATSGLETQEQDPVSQSTLLSGAMEMINEAGGISGVLQKLRAGGLEEQVASWIGTGENQPVSGQQIQDALGEGTIDKVAQQAGVAPEHASAGLAQLLPQIIDKLTPNNGQMPHGDLLHQGLNLLKGKLFG